MGLRRRVEKLENLDNKNLIDSLYMLEEVDPDTYKCNRRKVCYSLEEVNKIEGMGNKIIIVKWG